ncbi:MAG: hypothetical protein Ct9H300mP9_0460 [Candidatus Neomarinimicrobiota bacterium]|nr:MAG: hypothetical protein Ct9H300mP9_0460 [Candidatus Neomarinimicrobiota bacterium]
MGFMASVLISSVLVPILLGSICTKIQEPLAGLLSAGLGLSSTILLNVYIMMTGTFDIVEETYIVQCSESIFYRNLLCTLPSLSHYLDFL